jgi:hypothetical protein
LAGEHLGTTEAKWADIVAVSGDPLKDIKELHHEVRYEGRRHLQKRNRRTLTPRFSCQGS